MDIFDEIPEIDDEDTSMVRESAEKFIPCMLALRDGQPLRVRELWIEAFETAEVTD